MLPRSPYTSFRYSRRRSCNSGSQHQSHFSQMKQGEDVSCRELRMVAQLKPGGIRQGLGRRVTGMSILVRVAKVSRNMIGRAFPQVEAAGPEGF